jgi:hypothetical protein
LLHGYEQSKEGYLSEVFFETSRPLKKHGTLLVILQKFISYLYMIFCRQGGLGGSNLECGGLESKLYMALSEKAICP